MAGCGDCHCGCSALFCALYCKKKAHIIIYLSFVVAPSRTRLEHVPAELLFNSGNVHAPFRMRRMPADSLKWILFHTPLSGKRHLYTGPPWRLLFGLIHAWFGRYTQMRVCVWVSVCSRGGWGRVGPATMTLRCFVHQYRFLCPDQSLTAPPTPPPPIPMRFTRSTGDSVKSR